MTIAFDFTNMMAGALPGGITEQEWNGAQDAFTSAHRAVEAQRTAGTLGFFALPTNDALLSRTLAVADEARNRFDDVLLLGIGGSALGPIALRTALRPPSWNALDRTARGGAPRLHVLDNVDPATITAILARLDLARTLVLVVSKSGGTVETMAQYLIVRDALARVVGDKRARDHLVFVTDPEVGALRRIARAESITTLDIPPNVGGRFSVLSPVGLLPAALIGIDIRAMLAGAADATQRADTTDRTTNLAGAFATLQWLADTTGARFNAVPFVRPGESLTAVASGDTQYFIDGVSVSLPFLRAGKVKPVAVLSSTKLPGLEAYPLAVDSVKGFEVVGRFGLMATREVPKDALDPMLKAATAALAHPDVIARLTGLGLFPNVGGPAEYLQQLKGENDLWRRIVRQAGLSPE